jgi:urease accessory protein
VLTGDTATVVTGMATEPPASASTSHDAALAQLRLYQLVSPALPIGGFTYSQGLEWAVESGWVTDGATLSDWLIGLIDDGLTCLELPVLVRLYRACESADREALQSWGLHLLASRESAELRAEERNRARALVGLLEKLGVGDVASWRDELLHCQLAPYALAAVRWTIPLHDSLQGYAWTWLENQVAAAIKLVPLGQTDGQRVLLELAARLPPAVARALEIDDDEIGAAAPALAIASACHETQYTRLFRS